MGDTGARELPVGSTLKPSELARLVPWHLAIRYGVVPWSLEGTVLHLLSAERLTAFAQDDLASATGYVIHSTEVSPADLAARRKSVYQRE